MSIDKTKKVIEKILSVLNKAKISTDKYNSTQQPFFCQNIEGNFEIKYNINDHFKKIPSDLNRNIILIYNIFGSPSQEIYLGDWTILSLEESLKQYNDYCHQGQNKVFNVAYRYLGMGHVEVLSCDLDSHLLFYRRDGGSNGYDREANFLEIIKNKPSKYKQFYFSDWFYKINL